MHPQLTVKPNGVIVCDTHGEDFVAWDDRSLVPGLPGRWECRYPSGCPARLTVATVTA